MTVSDEHTSLSVNTRLKPDWEKYQGTPSAHFTMAKEQGYDFYVTTDPSQDSTFHPSGPDNPKWLETLRDARDATDKTFVALTVSHCSDNTDPFGRGPINIIKTTTILNTLV